MLLRRRVVIGCRALDEATSASAAASDDGVAGGTDAGVPVDEQAGSTSSAWLGVRLSRLTGEAGLRDPGGVTRTAEGPAETSAWPPSVWLLRGAHGDVNSWRVPAGDKDELHEASGSKVMSYLRMRSSIRAGSVMGKKEDGVERMGEDFCTTELVENGNTCSSKVTSREI